MIVPIRFDTPDFRQAVLQITRAAEVCNYPLPKIVDDLLAGRLALWGIYKHVHKEDCDLPPDCTCDPGLGLVAAFTTSFEPNGLLVSYLGGRGVEGWIHELEPWLDQFARVNGFKQVFMWGRAGWSRLAREYGWEDRQRLFVKEIVQ